MKVSIIVPVYNTAKYLEECLLSLVTQTIDSKEVLLIDDGSTDSSGEIAKKFAEKYSFVKYYFKANGGQSSARNMGLEKASGEYIMFVDSDDFIKLDSAEILFNKAKRNNLDIIRGKSINCYENGDLYCSERKITYTQPNQICNGKEFLYKSVIDQSYDIVPVINLISLEFLLSKKITFIEGLCMEDHLFTLQLLMSAEKVMQVEFPFYFYRHRAGSTTTNINKKQCKDLNIIMKKMIYYLESFKFKEKEKQKYYIPISISVNIFIKFYKQMPKCDRREMYKTLDKTVFKVALKYPAKNKFRSLQNSLFVLNPMLEAGVNASLIKLYLLLKKFRRN